MFGFGYVFVKSIDAFLSTAWQSYVELIYVVNSIIKTKQYI